MHRPVRIVADHHLRHNGRNAGTDGVAANESALANEHTGDIGNRVQRPGGEDPDFDAKIPRTWSLRATLTGSRNAQSQEKEKKYAAHDAPHNTRYSDFGRAAYAVTISAWRWRRDA